MSDAHKLMGTECHTASFNTLRCDISLFSGHHSFIYNAMDALLTTDDGKQGCTHTL